MQVPLSPDWVFEGTGWVLAGSALMALVWALAWDRSRGRRRCPRCWYGMDGVPSPTCPECGRAVKSEGALFRTRRRWRFAVAAATAALIGLGLTLTPRVRRDGPLSVVPATLLIPFLPDAGEEGHWNQVAGQWRYDPVSEEMSRRVVRSGLWGWQWRWALSRARVIQTRALWPVDRPLEAGVRIPSWCRH